MKTPHKHAALIKQWADGAKIEYKTKIDTEWQSLDSAGAVIGWHDYCDYRVKPEPKPDTVKIRRLTYNDQCDFVLVESVKSGFAYVRLVFDGETGALKDCQFLAKE